MAKKDQDGFEYHSGAKRLMKVETIRITGWECSVEKLSCAIQQLGSLPKVVKKRRAMMRIRCMERGRRIVKTVAKIQYALFREK